MTTYSRHQAAVANSLSAADAAAADGDLADAVAWLETIRAIGDELPPEYELKLERWRQAAAS